MTSFCRGGRFTLRDVGGNGCLQEHLRLGFCPLALLSCL